MQKRYIRNTDIYTKNTGAGKEWNNNMFSSDQIADVQGFNKVYLHLCKRTDSAILDAGYSLTEKDVLLEISKAERCTANILECNSVPAGSITVAKADRDTAQIRFFMLEPEMRRRGYGNRLIDLAIDFCRKKGYKRVFLLTITTQVVARHVYETHGFYKVWSRDKSEWGDGVVEERWDLEL